MLASNFDEKVHHRLCSLVTSIIIHMENLAYQLSSQWILGTANVLNCFKEGTLK